MYEILLDGETLYHPNSDTKIIAAAVISEKLNDAGYMEITIPSTNPLWDKISEHISKIEVYRDEAPIWYGFVKDITIDFTKNKSIYVCGELAYLNQTVQRQQQFSGSRTALLSRILELHNASSREQFVAGYYSQGGNKNISFVTDWEYTLESLRKHLCDDNEYIRIRHENGVRYIDILNIADYGKMSEQYISLGENLIDYAQENTGDVIATGCIPLGVSLDEGGIDGYENYLTCEAANEGNINVWNAPAINKYGYITKVVHFNVLDTPEALVTAAENYLRNTQFAKISLQLTAFDLSIIDRNIDTFEVGDHVRAVCKPFGMDAWMPVREKETDLLDLANNKITIGAEETKSITTIQRETISDVKEIIPAKSEVLSQAMRNASNMINANGDNGHVVLKTNNDGVVSEILIMDTADIDTATKMWRWNEGGFGFRRRDNIGSEWHDYDVAITMNGEVVADAITTGTMYADRIKGGTLTLGGLNNESGTLSLRDENNNEVSNMTKNGINIRKGKIELGTIVFDDVEYPNTIIDDSGNISIGAYNKPNAGKTPAFKVYSDGSLLMRNLLQITANNNDTFMSFGGTWGDSLTVMVNNNHEAGLGVAHQSDKFRYAVYMHYNDIRWYNNDYNPRYAMFGPTQESDIRLKKNIKEVDKDKISELFKRFHFVTFNYKNPKDTYLHHGLIAQEVEELMDEIGFDKDDYIEKAPKNPNDGEVYYQLMYTSLSRLAMIAIQDLYEKIENLEAQIRILKEGDK